MRKGALLIAIALAASALSLPVIELHQGRYEINGASSATLIIKADKGSTYRVEVELEGARLLGGGKELKVTRSLARNEALRLDLEFVPTGPRTYVTVKVNSVVARGVLGNVKVPGALAEYRIEGNVLKLGLWNPSEKPARFLVTFYSITPIKKALKYYCVKENSAISKYYQCVEKVCVSSFYGKLKCAKWAVVKELRYSCVQWERGECVKYYVIAKPVKKCVEKVAERKCWVWGCKAWRVREVPVRYCEERVAKVVETNGISYGSWHGEVRGFEELAIPFKYREDLMEASGNEATLFQVYVETLPLMEVKEEMPPNLLPAIEVSLLFLIFSYALWKPIYG